CFVCFASLLLLTPCRSSSSNLFPYTTLFRSETICPRDILAGCCSFGLRQFVNAANRPCFVILIHVPIASRSLPASMSGSSSQKWACAVDLLYCSSRLAITTSL